MCAFLKVIEVIAESEKSWEDASNNAISLASNAVQNIKSIDIEGRETNINDDNNINYRVRAKVAFLINV